jgi:hypothetical protein
MNSTIIAVLIFVAGPGGSLQVVQKMEVPDEKKCMELVKEINLDKSTPFVAACYSDVRVRGS